ncbi:branched-chain amino acid ABC transporter permease [Tardiphaga sp. 862_B3_N4_1]|uniref:branched-chain amino acid ABC transporter permease n=1 Tax=Tardiphaga sp. 862_B3_N4_1 TaxID=3240764 RepID=UPI003F21CC74
MPEFFQFLVSGLTIGAVYALVALGFTLVYNASDVVNFAQGEFVMLGGMVTVFVHAAGVPLPLAALVAVIVSVVLGLSLYWLAIAPARGASAVSLIIITIGASILLRGAAQIVFDKQFHKLPAFSGDTPVQMLGAAVQPQSFWVIGGTAVMVLLLYVFLERTLLGKAVLATSANRFAARLVGINTTTIMALAFGGSAAIGGVAGILITPITLTSYDVGTLLALKGFAAAMLGGMGNPLGAVAGGLLLGLLEAFDAGYISSTYKDAFAFIVILAVLFAAPQGLFGRRTIERV